MNGITALYKMSDCKLNTGTSKLHLTKETTKNKPPLEWTSWQFEWRRCCFLMMPGLS